jgi:hypothetical protein
MGSKLIVESLTEANKKILEISNKIENENLLGSNKQGCIDDLNRLIRQLDHIVETLEHN